MSKGTFYDSSNIYIDKIHSLELHIQVTGSPKILKAHWFQHTLIHFY